MVEVFITDVKDQREAQALLERIHAAFTGYEANFDLEDCDRILRILSLTGYVETYRVIRLLRELGCHAEVLPDIIPDTRI
ncbi:MAG: hypothetical protein BGO55_06950 [Sphingobacteriales bacterium 50-39]|nr:hypothetical protein [Sphingobacteriales bacterium]OJW52989.1 MAG: hypothetical protein BGO55_06950 [Sphingobacteriales bacterium 50-39]